MYGKLPTIGGIVALPATGNSKPLFIAAVCLIVAGVVTMAVSGVITHRSRG